MKNIRIVIMLCLFSFVAIVAKADVSISEYIIDGSYLNNGKLRLNTGQETPFTAKFTLIKGSATDNINVTVAVVLVEGSTRTVISNQLTRFSGDWPSQNNYWTDNLTCKLPAGKTSGRVFLLVTRFYGTTPGSGELSSTGYSLDGPTVTPPTPPDPVPDKEDRVSKNKTFNGGSLVAKNGKYHLEFQTDGNLVLYSDNWQALWASKTDRYKMADPKLIFAEDGRVYIADGKIIRWIGNPNSQKLEGENPTWYLQEDGNFVGYDESKFTTYWPRKVIGSTNTQGGTVSYRWGDL